MLVPYVLIGQFPEEQDILPIVYRIDHPKLTNRRYVGHWVTWAPNGDIMWFPQSPYTQFRLYFDVGHPKYPNSLHIGMQSRQQKPQRIDIHIGNKSQLGWEIAMLERFLRRIVGSSYPNTFFIGQDANMLRQCMQTPFGATLLGTAFTQEIQLAETMPTSEDENFPRSIQVIRNGSIIADSTMVQIDDDPDFWKGSD